MIYSMMMKKMKCSFGNGKGKVLVNSDSWLEHRVYLLRHGYLSL